MITAVLFQKGDFCSVLITLTTKACSSSGFELPGWASLIRRSLQVTHRGKIASRKRVKEIMSIVLMVPGVACLPDARDTRRPGMRDVLCRSVVLEGLVMLNVIGFRKPGYG